MNRVFPACVLGFFFSLCALASVPAFPESAVGQLVGYEEMDARFRARLFKEPPFCPKPADAVVEYHRLTDVEVADQSPEDRTLAGELQVELSLPEGFLLSGILGDFKPNQTGVAQVLGARFYPDIIAATITSNHEVNALNLFAWDLLLSELATRVGALCDQFGSGVVSPTLTLSDSSLRVASLRQREIPLDDDFREAMAPLCAGGAVSNDNAFRERAEALFQVVTGFSFPETELQAWLEEVSSPENRRPIPKETVAFMLRTLFLNPYFLLRH